LIKVKETLTKELDSAKSDLSEKGNEIKNIKSGNSTKEELIKKECNQRNIILTNKIRHHETNMSNLKKVLIEQVDSCHIHNNEFKSLIKSKININNSIINFEEDLSITFKKLLNEIVNKNNQKSHDDSQIQILQEEILNNKVDLDIINEKLKVKNSEIKETRSLLHAFDDKLNYLTILQEENKVLKKNEEKYVQQIKSYEEQVNNEKIISRDNLNNKIKDLRELNENLEKRLEAMGHKDNTINSLMDDNENLNTIIL